MCTAITLNDINKNYYFGRTFDFSYTLDPSLYYCPKKYVIKSSFSDIDIKNKYSFMGIGQNISSVVFVDGINEKGLAMAALYFPNYAKYDLPFTNQDKYQIPSTEIVNFVLGNCKNIHEAYFLLHNTNIIGTQDPITNTIAPLHWIVVDRTGTCVVVEKTNNGFKILMNPIGVLSNSPNFEWHMTNLQNYMNVSSIQNEKEYWDSLPLTPFGQGAGTFGLPGDFTPPSRFVRTSFLKSHITLPENQEESISAFFHIMESVSIPKGVVITSRGTIDYTQFTSFMDLKTCEYFFKTYDNSKIITTNFTTYDKSKEITEILSLNNI